MSELPFFSRFLEHQLVNVTAGSDPNSLTTTIKYPSDSDQFNATNVSILVPPTCATAGAIQSPNNTQVPKS